MEEIKFNPEFEEPMINDEKTATIRYWDEYRVLPGDPFTAINAETDRIIINGTIEDVVDRTVKDIVENNVRGHRNYESVEELINELETYYPDGRFTEDTELQVLYW